MTLRQKRHAAALSTLERTIRLRDKTLAKLVRLEGKLPKLRRQVQRLEREPAKPATATPTPELQSATPAPVPPSVDAAGYFKPKPKATPGPVAPAIDAAGIPDFLRRAADASKEKDAEARAGIEAERAARTKTKKAVQAEKRKARQAGDLKRMPLTGRDAMRALSDDNAKFSAALFKR